MQGRNTYIDSKVLENQELPMLRMLVTLRDSPHLLAKILNKHQKKVSQSIMNYLVLGLFSSLQVKSCSCKTPFQKFVFIRSIFELETKDVNSIDQLRDNCPLLLKLIKSLFDNIKVYDFLAMLLKKLLKKNYMKEIISQQYDLEIQRRHTRLQKLRTSADTSQLVGKSSIFRPQIPIRRKKEQRTVRDLTAKTRPHWHGQKYKNIVNKVFLKSGDDSLSVMDKDNSSNWSTIFSRRKETNLVDLGIRSSEVFGSDSVTPGTSMDTDSTIFWTEKFIKTQKNELINEQMMRDVMVSLINAARLTLPQEIKYLFHLFAELAESRSMAKSDIVNVFFFQLLLIRKCTVDNFHQVD